MRSVAYFSRSAAMVLCLALLTPAAQAFDPLAYSYWISMRGITENAQPSFVAAAYASGGSTTTAFTGCADHTYYLTAANAATVQAARTAGDTVQVHRGAQGGQASEAAVICLVQADQ